MTYRVLARAWRPQQFDQLLGQEAVVRTLGNALEAGTVGHAYLFSGLRGVGKTTAARLLAKAMNCSEGPTSRPCDACESCREIAEGSSLDVVELDAATHTGVDDVRELQSLLRYRPSRDRYRVIIVDEVHMLSRSAFNALLKSLEEPRPWILWILATTERHKVPATILSRCQQLEFRPVAADTIAQRLLDVSEHESFELAADAADAVARAAEGSVRDALSMLDQLRAFSGDTIDEAAVTDVLGVPAEETIVRLVEALSRGDAAGGGALLQGEMVAGHDPTVLYRETGRQLRAMVHLALGSAADGGASEQTRRRIEPLAREIGETGLTRLLGLWVEHESLLREASNRELALEVACLRLTRWPAVQAAERLVDGAAGGDPPPGSPPPSEPGRSHGSVADAGSPKRRLADALEHNPRVASAVAHAEVAMDGDEVVLRLRADAAALRAPLEGARDTVEEAVRGTLAPATRFRVEVEPGGEESRDLMELARSDPGVLSACRALRGEVVAVRPDREPS